MTTLSDLNQLYSLRQAAAATGVAYPTILRWVRAGRLRSRRVGRNHLVQRDEVHRLGAESQCFYAGQRRGGQRTAARRGESAPPVPEGGRPMS